MTAFRKNVYRYADLSRALKPKSIVIIGASPRAGGFSERLANNLVDFDGEIYLVNENYSDVNGKKCYSNVADLPVVPDCAVLTVPNHAVEALVQECGDAGVGGAVIFASGFAESGDPAFVAAQQRLGVIAQQTGIKVIGPNCMGFANYSINGRVTFVEYPAVTPGKAAAVGIASQSGGLSLSLSQAAERGLSVSHAYSTGNSCDVDVADLISFLADDPDCKSIACVFEGMAHPERMLEAAEIALAAGKPLLIHKIATGAIGAAAALSHTGSLAGSDAVYRAAFKRVGAIIIDDFEALMEAAAFFAKAPAKATAKGVAVVATSGGASIMAADKAELHGVPLPQPKASVMAVLEEHIPSFGSARNPCDVTAQVVSNPNSLNACGDALLSDEIFGAIIVPQSVAFDAHTPRIKVFGDLAKKYGKVACNVTISDWLQGPSTFEAESDENVTQFRSMSRCFATLAAWHKRTEYLNKGQRKFEKLVSSERRKQAEKCVADGKARTLSERESKVVLDLYGIPVVKEILVQTADEAIKAATELGYPVVMKLESPDLPHKTEAGVIRLNLKNEQDVVQAYAEVMANANKVEPAPSITGVLVQPMVGAGVELMVGAKLDPQFGAVIVAGIGGTMVELLKDTSIELAPVTPDEAEDMLLSLRGRELLEGFRGSEPVNIALLKDVICRISELISDDIGIVEIDVNPLICGSGRVLAVDALIVKNA